MAYPCVVQHITLCSPCVQVTTLTLFRFRKVRMAQSSSARLKYENGSSSSSPNWRHNVLFPFWNGPDFSKPGTEIYAGRYNQYKIHWVTSMGLVSGTHLLNQTMRHDPPLVFDVDSDPAEAFALTLSKEMLEKIEAEKKRLTFIPNAIDPRFGMEWALCCDRTTNCTCDTPREIQG